MSQVKNSNGPNATEQAFEKLGIKGFCNPWWMPTVEWINGVPYYPAYKARSCIEEKINKLEKQNTYLSMIASKAIARLYKMHYFMAESKHYLENGRKKNGMKSGLKSFIHCMKKQK